ncbi:TIGR04282 family arsenosugar biosynthesis glycosyltransferase [Nocardioides marmorisolisilvae]|uniref:DUF2064 domain-containing protein n=1 Tax=Nocardioides marmorisolisilvae TaxID=1542737 RepID=A0A3N0DTQ8_9ACTN|nr:DUF2064 domain-containing protein [Nocardioides marmorisolisilvae]RNL79000.1 DUF2064 domain-containing protein [Nocardioides marmorisolisilvae]
MTGRALVMAKSPVPGRVKTRLAADVGHELAAELAARALLDTLAACSEAFSECHLALDGDLADAASWPALREATAGWQVFPQCSGVLGDRLAHAHARVAQAGPGPVVQVGMDTPQLTAGDLVAVAERSRPGTAVLGPAEDGGWWVLGLADPDAARSLVDVPMSTAVTGALTAQALRAAGLLVDPAPRLRDVDTLADAVAVAAEAPWTQFAACWRRHRSVVA